MRRLVLFFLLAPWAVPCGALSKGQLVPPLPPALTPAQAQALVTRALATELNSAQDTSHPMRYRLHRKSPRLTSTKDVIETRDGDVARLVAIDDKPLTEADQQQEEARLTALERDPSLQRHRKQGEEGDTGIVLRLVRMLPNAFLYQYTGVAAGPRGPVEKFSFVPNPRFSPPDIETQALTSMTGELWIDATQERVTRLEGHLRQDTDYAWGVAKLRQGGWVVLEQADVGARQWRVVHFQMVMSMRILFKNKSSDTTQDLTGYTPVPAGVDYRKAIQMLRGTK